MKKVILITGTSSGFGKIAAQLLAADGHAVYGTMRNIGSGNARIADQMRHIPNLSILDADLLNTESINKAVNTVYSKEGRLDVLINNAGSFYLGVTEAFTEHDLQQIFDEDVLGPWRFIRAALPYFRQQNSGQIITVTSSLGRFGSPFMAAYSSAKHALEGLLEGIKIELKGFNIDISIIEPGIYPTNIFNRSKGGSDDAINVQYGQLGHVADGIKAQLTEVFASGNASDPMLVAMAMKRLVDLPASERPLREVVDPAAGEITKRANNAMAKEYNAFLIASGMGGIL